MHLRTLSNDELARYATSKTTTDLERELIQRFETLEGYQAVIDVLDSLDFDTDDAENLESELQQINDERDAANERVAERDLQLDELRERIADLEAQLELV